MNQKDKAKVAYDVFRLLGWGFLLFGSMIVIVFAISTFNPESEIIINRVPTKDFDQKLKATLFAAIFPIIGAFITFSPKKRIERMIARTYNLKPDENNTPNQALQTTTRTVTPAASHPSRQRVSCLI